jgi:hypothetical protein
MKVTRAAISRNLPKKGFRKEESGHHIYFYHEYKGMEFPLLFGGHDLSCPIPLTKTASFFS